MLLFTLLPGSDVYPMNLKAYINCHIKKTHAFCLVNCSHTLTFQGLSVTEVTEGYEFAVKKALEILPGKLLLNRVV